jgi:O-Antigen ligase
VLTPVAEVSVLPVRRTGGIPAPVGRWVWPSLLGLVPILSLGAAQGGYFPSAWGWAALGLLWAAGLALVLRSSARLSSSECAFVLAWGGLAAWIALSMVWSRDLPQTVLELERVIVYFAAALAVVVIARTRSAQFVLGGLLAAISLIAAFSLATRLFPGQLQVYDRNAVYRLAQPIGYWNGLAIFTAMGSLLALGFAARAHRPAARALCAGLVIVLLPTFYFTFGRSGWIALAAGLVLAVLIDPRRLQLLTTLLVMAPASIAAVWLAAHSHGLTRAGAPAAQATSDGHFLAIALVLLAGVNAAAVLLVAFVERRLVLPAAARRVFAGALLVSLAVVLALTFAHYGSPSTLVRKGYSAFKAPTPHVVNLNRRLLNFSGNGRYELWRLAWTDARAHPWLGSGAGSYERYFLQHQPPNVGRVRDAHGLYVETLAELGPVGLVLLLVCLGVPLFVAVRARTHSFVPAAAGAYGAFLVHAIADWDWELPAVTVSAILCGGAILVAGRRFGHVRSLSVPLRSVAVIIIVAVGAFASIGLVGNSALKASDGARRAGQWDRAASEARRARAWMPWSPAPWAALGNAQLGAGLVRDARGSFRKAVSMDPKDWELWYDLARASRGRGRIRALHRAVALYPRSRLVPED